MVSDRLGCFEGSPAAKVIQELVSFGMLKSYPSQADGRMFFYCMPVGIAEKLEQHSNAMMLFATVARLQAKKPYDCNIGRELVTKAGYVYFHCQDASSKEVARRHVEERRNAMKARKKGKKL